MSYKGSAHSSTFSAAPWTCGLMTNTYNFHPNCAGFSPSSWIYNKDWKLSLFCINKVVISVGEPLTHKMAGSCGQDSGHILAVSCSNQGSREMHFTTVVSCTYGNCGLLLADREVLTMFDSHKV